MAKEEQIISVIPEQLIRARESLGFQSREVAEALHIDQKKLNEWEKGITEPPVYNLWNLAEPYRRSTDYFLRRSTPFMLCQYSKDTLDRRCNE